MLLILLYGKRGKQKKLEFLLPFFKLKFIYDDDVLFRLVKMCDFSFRFNVIIQMHLSIKAAFISFRLLVKY